ncbi:MAG TPA: glutamate racemase [Gemmatimonadaceae bacterium]|nr:glutamate racemase [Gemmatimonadaceae bacterium]
MRAPVDGASLVAGGGDHRDSPIGVFDSGVGGLTVVHELVRQLPDESIVYVGDTARVPYGPKSPETVRRYSREIAAFLCEQGVKAVVVACNTATAHALDALEAELPVPVIGVVKPGARAAVATSRTRRIGVIGTTGTVRSGAYEAAIRRLAPEATVLSQPCPLFVPLVEEGWTEHEAARLVAFEYLAPLARAAVDTLVLGCTHYPLLKRLIGETVGRDVRLIDSAEETAAEVGRTLGERGIRATPGRAPSHRFYATDDAAQMLRLGQRFLGGAMEHVETLALAG